MPNRGLFIRLILVTTFLFLIACGGSSDEVPQDAVDSNPLSKLKISEIVFTDPVLADCINQAVTMLQTSITDPAELAELDCGRRTGSTSPKITDLTGLHYFSGLKSLKLNNNAITSIDELSGLALLSVLDLSVNGITDYSAVAKLINLTELDLNSNFVRDSVDVGVDLTPLASLKSLQVLNISAAYNQNEDLVNSVSALANLTNLTVLHFDGQRVQDISALSGLVNLKELFASNNRINNISVMEYMNVLSNVRLLGNAITSLAPIANLTELKDVNFSSNKIDDSNMKYFQNLTNLTSIDISDNSVDISNLTPLINISGLRSLNLSNCSVTDFSSLVGKKEMNQIRASNCGLIDISSLSVVSSAVTRLYLDGNQISNITVLGSFTKLVRVDLSKNSIEVASAFADLSAAGNNLSLNTIDLIDNMITDISPFLGLSTPTLSRLDLTGNNNIPCSDLAKLNATLGEAVVRDPASCVP